MQVSWFVPIVVAAGAALHAAPPEVTGVGFVDKTTLTWDALPAAAGFHVYREEVANLPDYGNCLLGSIPATQAQVGELPPSGSAFFYLLTAFDDTGEGSAGESPSLGPRNVTTPCTPSRRILAFAPNGDGGDGVEDGVEPLRNASMIARGEGRQTIGVYLHTGEVFLHAVDVGFRARAGSEGLLRAYRNQLDYDGPLGHGWDFNYNRRLRPVGSDAVYHDGSGRREAFGRIDATHFTSPPGRYDVLFENPDGAFRMRSPQGVIQRFHAFDGSNVEGALEEVEDRDGNATRLLYDHQGLLTTVVDDMGRSLGFEYDANGRLTQTTDFVGRQCVYTYDGAGDLVSARTPTVVGTPNGNDFPSGKTTQYGYDSGQAEERLNHNLLTITAPNEEVGGPARVIVNYGLAPASPEFDRAMIVTLGGTNASGIFAGGDLSLAYEQLNPGGDPADLLLPRRKATVTDRNGNLTVYEHNVNGNAILRTDFTNRELRPGEPDYLTQSEFNADGERTRIVLPEGNEWLFLYDSLGPDRYRQGNLLESRRIAGPRGDGLGGGLNDLVTTYAYDPIYNLRRTVTDPRGNDLGYIPQNGGVQSPARYTWERFFDHQEDDPAINGLNEYAGLWEIDTTGLLSGLGDLNGDGRLDQIAGRVILDRAPSVLLDGASDQAAIEGDTDQDVETRRRWNDFGQLLRVEDPEGNVDEYLYYPETDPDGDGNPTPAPSDGRLLDGTTGGYLQSSTQDTTPGADRNNKTDPPPASVVFDFTWNTVGELARFVDGRGVLTRRVYNELNQVVQLRRAAATADAGGPDGDPPTGTGENGLDAFSFKINLEYDANDNVVARRVEDRGETRGLGPELDTTYVYDILDRRIRVTEEATSLGNLVTELRYDANENPIRVIEPEGNEHQTAYDERDLVLSGTRGALGPRGGLPSIESYDYDGNGNLIDVTDPRGNLTDYVYDGMDRRVRVIDEVGNAGTFTYDPADRLVESLLRGPVGGATPGDRLGTTNTDLERTEYLYDELYRVFRVDAELFVPAGAPTGRPPNITEGPLVPADGALNRILEYDRLSRLTFVREDTGQTTRYDYDGLDRRVLTTLPDSSFVEYHYDPRDNLIERVELEKPSLPGPSNEEFITTYAYDSLDRRIRIVDSIGQTSRVEYDSLDRVTTATDGNGPAGGSINRRSPGRTGISVPINGHGNVTRYVYDGLDRRVSTERVLAPSGLGDGTTAPAPDLTNPFNADGLIRIQLEWDDNSLPSKLIDDRLNETTYAYDNLDRRILVTYDDQTTTQLQYDENDNLLQRIDANGSGHDHTYDDADRRTMTTYAPAAGVEGTNQQQFEYDGLSRLTKATDVNAPANPNDNVTAEYVYDSLSRRIEEKQTLSDGSAVQLTGYHWQSLLVSKLIYPGNRELEYSYDGFDRLTAISDLDPGRPESASFDYFGMHRVHTRSLSNGVRTTTLNDTGDADIGFDGVRRLTNLRHLDPGNVLLGGFEYGWDRAHSRLYERRAHHPDGMGNARGERYSRDSAYRLIDFQEGDLDADGNLIFGPYDAWSFTLDGVGNWPEMTRNGQGFGATPNNLNEYDEDQTGGTRVDDGIPDDFADPDVTPEPDGVNLAHDKKGDQTLNANMETAFDASSRAVRATDTLGAVDIGSYVYDGMGRRVRRQVTGLGDLDETLRFTWSGGALLEEREEGGPGGRDLIPTEAVPPSYIIDISGSMGWGTQTYTKGGKGVGVLKGSMVQLNSPFIGGGTGSGMGSLLMAGPIKLCSYDKDGNGRIAGGGTGGWASSRRYGDLTQTLELKKGGNTVKECSYDKDGRIGMPIKGGASGTTSRLSSGRPLWQVRTDNTAQYALEDGRGNTALVVDGAAPVVLERMTYDAWGKPQFEDSGNNPLFDMGGLFAPRSDFGVAELWGGVRYDPEYGQRTADPNTDLGGYYNVGATYYNPNQGRNTTREGSDSLGFRGHELLASWVGRAYDRGGREQGLYAVRQDPVTSGGVGSGSFSMMGHEVTHVAQTGGLQAKGPHDRPLNTINNPRSPIAGGTGSGGGGGFPVVLRQGGTSTVTGIEMFRSDGTPLRATMNTTWKQGITKDEVGKFRIPAPAPPPPVKDISIEWLGPDRKEPYCIDLHDCTLLRYTPFGGGGGPDVLEIEFEMKPGRIEFKKG